MVHPTHARVRTARLTRPVTVALVYRNFGLRGSLEQDHVRLASELAARGLEVHCFGIPERRTTAAPDVVHHDVHALLTSRSRLGFAVECTSFARRATREIRRRRAEFTLVDVSGSDCWEQDVVTIHGVTR